MILQPSANKAVWCRPKSGADRDAERGSGIRYECCETDEHARHRERAAATGPFPRHIGDQENSNSPNSMSRKGSEEKNRRWRDRNAVLPADRSAARRSIPKKDQHAAIVRTNSQNR
jgi:hypothetical protein